MNTRKAVKDRVSFAAECSPPKNKVEHPGILSVGKAPCGFIGLPNYNWFVYNSGPIEIELIAKRLTAGLLVNRCFRCEGGGAEDEDGRTQAMRGKEESEQRYGRCDILYPGS